MSHVVIALPLVERIEMKQKYYLLYHIYFILQGDLLYVNYGRIEDFTWLKEEKNVDFTGKICIARYGKIFRGDKVGSYDM